MAGAGKADVGTPRPYKGDKKDSDKKDQKQDKSKDGGAKDDKEDDEKKGGGGAKGFFKRLVKA